MSDEIENLKSGKNSDDTIRVTRLSGVPVDLSPNAHPGYPSPDREGGTAVSRLSRRLDRARERGEDLAPGQALRDACPELFNRSEKPDS